jgi:hypothetical protein
MSDSDWLLPFRSHESVLAPDPKLTEATSDG